MNSARVTQALTALNGFFVRFLPAYAEGCAPEGAALPYITYSLTVPDALGEAPLYARVWYRGRGYSPVAATLDAIDRAIGPGCRIPAGDGALWLHKSENFLQFLPAPDDALKCARLSLKLTALV